MSALGIDERQAGSTSLPTNVKEARHELRFVRGMLTPAQCRELAKSYRNQSVEPGINPQRASLLRNIAHSYASLASQLEMLAEAERAQRQ
jgi:hypothetical protein